MTDEQLPTPGQVATNEAARQAVMLVFGVVMAMIVMKIQTKMVRDMTQAQRTASDPDAARTQRMQEAKRLERYWSTAARWIGEAGLWAWRQADKARAAYEKDRA